MDRTILCYIVNHALNMDELPAYIGVLLFLHIYYQDFRFLCMYTIWESTPVTVNNRKYLWYCYDRRKQHNESYAFCFSAKKIKLLEMISNSSNQRSHFPIIRSTFFCFTVYQDENWPCDWITSIAHETIDHENITFLCAKSLDYLGITSETESSNNLKILL